jgi:nucleoside-diphosphate-sugar epimerase
MSSWGPDRIGLAVMQLLVAKGRRERVVNRSGQTGVPAGVAVLSGDLGDLTFAWEASRGAQAIYLCANPPYTQMADKFQPIMDGAIAAAAASGAQLINADSLYAYGPVTGPITESLPYAAMGRKGRARAHLATQLMAARLIFMARACASP